MEITPARMQEATQVGELVSGEEPCLRFQQSCTQGPIFRSQLLLRSNYVGVGRTQTPVPPQAGTPGTRGVIWAPQLLTHQQPQTLWNRVFERSSHSKKDLIARWQYDYTAAIDTIRVALVVLPTGIPPSFGPYQLLATVAPTISLGEGLPALLFNMYVSTTELLACRLAIHFE